MSGPVSDKAGRRSVENYLTVIGKYGYTPTFFVHPELTEIQRDFFLNLRDKGAGLGLHLHPTKFTRKKCSVEMGGLSEKQQREILGLAVDMFEQNLGIKPQLFRPGAFSANDYTYKVLNELGFRGGSISIPGRIWAERFCIWSGAYPYPHLANSNMRQVPGNLPFVEIPLTVDFSRPLRLNHQGYHHYFDLRPGEKIYAGNTIIQKDFQLILENIAKQLVKNDPMLKTIVIDTHNDLEYLDRETESARHLHILLEHIDPVLKKYGLEPLDATMDKAIERFLEKDNEGE
ncbi:MAG: polysaccharide deacetylase family protein [Victivallaceae bacterium]|nr:polysaccharide deacetylase family protein [Victivallaceae bacterium]